MINPFWDKTVTVFTYFNDGTNNIWGKWIINNCFYCQTRQSDFVSEEVWQKNKYLCRIPKISEHVDYNKWLENRTKFSVEPFRTIVFCGEIKEVIEPNRNWNELRKSYPNNFILETFSNNTFFKKETCGHYVLSGA